MAVGADTRERPGARSRENRLPEPAEDIGSLLMSGMGGDDDDEGVSAGTSDEDELDLPGDDFEDNEDEYGEEDEDDGDGAGDAGDEDPETAGDATPAAAADVLSEYVTTWAEKVRANPLAIMQVPGNRRKQVLKGAFAAERQAATEALREPVRQTLEQVTQQAYQQGREDARAELDGDAEFDEVRDLAENDLQAFGQLAHSAEGAAKVKRYLDRLEAAQNPGAQATSEAITSSAARLLAKVRGNTAAMAELQAKERANPGRYAYTAAGLEALTEDVAEALANARVAEANKAAEPTKKAVDARRNGAEHRRALPRTAGGEGNVGRGETDTSLFASAADDLRAGLREDTRPRRR